MQAAALAGAADPQLELNESEKQFHDDKSSPRYDANHNPSFAEYLHWARMQRAHEDQDKTVIHSAGISSLVHTIKGDKKGSDDGVVTEARIAEEQDEQLVGLSERDVALVNARRVLRQAGWASVFYLITCDILGPFNAPYSIASIGMAPGIILYLLFGVFAFLGGYALYLVFLRLDSVRYPVKLYGDLGQRVFGTWARYLSSFLQLVQLVLNVGLICLSNGQGLSQIINGAPGGHTLCFSVCVVIWALCGMVTGQIRTLKGIGSLANVSIWINLLIIFLSMGFVAHSPPNYAAAKASGIDYSGPPKVVAVVSLPIFAQVNGVFNMIFAYGGAMIFPEIMAEMRRPRDFIKGMAVAQLLIIVAYLLYGVFVYSFQGQYTLALAYQGVSKYSWQTVGNVLALITGLIAATLYGNIGLKVLYVNLIENLLKGPPLMTKRGHVLWVPMVILFWGAAFVIGSAIPSVGTLSGLVAAACIFQFSYTFPPALLLGLLMKIDAMGLDEPFTTPGVAPRQHDTWRSLSRWRRGAFLGGSKRVVLKSLLFLWFLASLATAGLGLWATGTDLREAISAGAASSFGCASPV
ncbi:uncharacterized protein JCM6883_001018 [Sporobolomyces salmoneus]|uniref:uncharacterized protein n=1 Tax=Sporobolomyces salmoneus TaxID=183962 RepID=UPI00317D51F3